MRDKKIFLDSNILVYAYDSVAGRKHERARKLVTELWARNNLPWISVQVLQETYINLQKKGVTANDTRKVVESYMQWNVVENDLPLLRDGMMLQGKYRISFWDALILAAAIRVGAEILYSEDFNNGQDYGGVKAVDPLLEL
jgi:predicted nucleic acid-binding protein